MAVLSVARNLILPRALFPHLRWPRVRVRRQPRVRYERVYVLDEVYQCIWEAMVPFLILRERLDRRARSTADTWLQYLVGGTVGWFVVFVGAALGFLSYFGDLIGAIVLAGPTAVPLGVPVGIWAGMMLGPKPFWIVRRAQVERDGGEATVEVSPVIHSKFREREWVEMVVKDDDGEEITYFRPHVIRASALHIDLMAKIQRQGFKGPRDKWAQIEMGLVAVMAISGLGMLVLFLLAQAE